MTQISPYINFNGRCREAMNFYKECFGGELTMQTVEGSAIEAQCPPNMKKDILHSTLVNGEMYLMGSDMTGPGGYTPGNAITLSINCKSEEEINSMFAKFAEGGQIIDPLKMQFWGAMFGVVTDRFGTRWMLNYDKNQNQ